MGTALYFCIAFLTGAVCVRGYSYTPDSASSCEHGEYIPDAECTRFWRCAHGKPFRMTCPAGLHFNTVAKVCDWPDKAGCIPTNGSPHVGASASYGPHYQDYDGDDRPDHDYDGDVKYDHDYDRVIKHGRKYDGDIKYDDIDDDVNHGHDYDDDVKYDRDYDSDEKYEHDYDGDVKYDHDNDGDVKYEHDYDDGITHDNDYDSHDMHDGDYDTSNPYLPGAAAPRFVQDKHYTETSLGTDVPIYKPVSKPKQHPIYITNNNNYYYTSDSDNDNSQPSGYGGHDNNGNGYGSTQILGYNSGQNHGPGPDHNPDIGLDLGEKFGYGPEDFKRHGPKPIFETGPQRNLGPRPGNRPDSGQHGPGYGPSSQRSGEDYGHYYDDNTGPGDYDLYHDEVYGDDVGHGGVGGRGGDHGPIGKGGNWQGSDNFKGRQGSSIDKINTFGYGKDFVSNRNSYISPQEHFPNQVDFSPVVTKGLPVNNFGRHYGTSVSGKFGTQPESIFGGRFAGPALGGPTFTQSFHGHPLPWISQERQLPSSVEVGGQLGHGQGPVIPILSGHNLPLGPHGGGGVHVGSFRPGLEPVGAIPFPGPHASLGGHHGGSHGSGLEPVGAIPIPGPHASLGGHHAGYPGRVLEPVGAIPIPGPHASLGGHHGRSFGPGLEPAGAIPIPGPHASLGGHHGSHGSGLEPVGAIPIPGPHASLGGHHGGLHGSGLEPVGAIPIPGPHASLGGYHGGLHGSGLEPVGAIPIPGPHASLGGHRGGSHGPGLEPVGAIPVPGPHGLGITSGRSAIPGAVPVGAIPVPGPHGLGITSGRSAIPGAVPVGAIPVPGPHGLGITSGRSAIPGAVPVGEIPVDIGGPHLSGLAGPNPLIKPPIIVKEEVIPRGSIVGGPMTVGTPWMGQSSLGKAFFPILQKNPQLSQLLTSGGKVLEVSNLGQLTPVMLNTSNTGSNMMSLGTGSGIGMMGMNSMMGTSGEPMLVMMENPMMMGSSMSSGHGLTKFLLPVQFASQTSSTTTTTTTAATTTTTGATSTATTTATPTAANPSPVSIFLLNPFLPPGLPLPAPVIGTTTTTIPLPRNLPGSSTAQSVLNAVLRDNRYNQVAAAEGDRSDLSDNRNARCTARSNNQRITLPLLQQSGNALTQTKCSALEQLINSYVNVYVENLPGRPDGSCVIQVPDIHVTCNTGSNTRNNGTYTR